MKQFIIISIISLTLSSPLFVNAAEDFTNGQLLRAEGDIKIYILNSHGYRRHVPSPEAFNSYGFAWDTVKDILKTEIEQYPETNLIRVAGTPEVFLVADEKRQWITSPEVFEGSGFDWNAVVVVSSKDVDNFSRGPDVAVAIPATPAKPAEPATPTEPQSEEPISTEPATPAQPADPATPAQPAPPPPPPLPPPSPPSVSYSITQENCSLYFISGSLKVLIYSDNYGCDYAATYWSDIVSSNGSYGITWSDARADTAAAYFNGLEFKTQIYFKKIDTGGQSLTSDIQTTQAVGSRGHNSIVWSGNEYGIAWSDNRDFVLSGGGSSGGDSDIYFTRVNSDGNKIGSDVRVSNTAEHSGSPELTWNGTGYNLTWVDNLNGTLVSKSAVLDSSGNTIQ